MAYIAAVAEYFETHRKRELIDLQNNLVKVYALNEKFVASARRDMGMEEPLHSRTMGRLRRTPQAKYHLEIESLDH